MKKKLFVHVPKTAGKSIFKCIDDDWKRSFPMKHDPYFHLQRLNTIDSDTFKFCVVRNPYTRSYSHYRHFLTQINDTEDGVSFNNFLKMMENKIFLQSVPMYIYPQTFFILNKFGEIEEDFNIFKFEKLEELEKSINIKLPKENVGNYTKENYYKNFDEKNILLIQKLFKIDFENFNYSKDFH